MRTKAIAGALVALALSGCVAVPMTPEEFRQSVRQDGEHFETLTVNRSYGEVSRTVKKMSDECLNFSFSTVTNGRTGKPWAWANSSFASTAKRAELRFQRKVKDQIGTYPENGMYYLVADLAPVAAARTKVDIYYWDDAAPAAKALKSWASGEILGCPDPAEMF